MASGGILAAPARGPPASHTGLDERALPGDVRQLDQACDEGRVGLRPNNMDKSHEPLSRVKRFRERGLDRRRLRRGSGRRRRVGRQAAPPRSMDRPTQVDALEDQRELTRIDFDGAFASGRLHRQLERPTLQALRSSSSRAGSWPARRRPTRSPRPARIAGVAKSHTVSNGKLVLTLRAADEGGFVVTSPLEPELITEAETIDDAFRMAQDALRALRASRTKLLRKLASSRRSA